MPKIFCASVDCKYNSDENTCTSKEVNLSDMYEYSRPHKNDDDVHFWKCRTYVESDQTKRIKMFFERIERLKSGAGMRGTS